MSQHDGTIANDTGANVRADIQSAVQAVMSTNIGTGAPSTTYAGMIYIDSDDGMVRVRNPANTAWILLPINVNTGSDGDAIGSGGFGPVSVNNTLGIQFADSTIQTTAAVSNNKYANFTEVWSTSATTWTAIGSTTFDCAITPISASSEVLVHVKLMFSFDDGGASPAEMYAPLLRIVRGATPVNVGDGADFADVTFETAAHYNGGSYGLPEYHLFCVNATFIDTPATTSATTYTLQVKLPSASMTFQTNQTITEFADINGHTNGCSSIVLQELNASIG